MLQTRLQYALIFAACAAVPSLASAQTSTNEQAPPAPQATEPPATQAAQPNVAETLPDVAEAKPQEETPKASPESERISALEARIAELENAASESASDSAAVEDRRLSAWGFFDITLGKFIYDNPGGIYAMGTINDWSFVTNGFNVYLKSEMTNTLSAMLETRLTFTPVGTQQNYPTNVYINGQYSQTVGTGNRVDQTVRVPFNYYLYHQHGIAIERAHLDWKPADWFGVRLGYFLTPFGIWNEDHGSPTLLGVSMPTLMSYELVPTHQMGIEVFGSRQLADSLGLDYAFTLSNGRGPIAEYKDLDANKAVGLRAKLVYSTDDWTLRLGGYGYYGRYTDGQMYANIWLTSGLTLDRSQQAPLGAAFTTTNAYRESVLTLEALARYKRLTLLAEVAQSKVVYDTAPELNSQLALLNNVPYGAKVYAAGYTGSAYYGLVAYEIPLGESLGNVTVTPYVGADHISPDKTAPVLDQDLWRAGLNVKPSPYVVNKLEVIRDTPRCKEVASNSTAVLIQTAVAF